MFLTLLGGGVFRNETDWIIEAIRRALKLYRHADLDVAIVSYGSSRRYVRQLVDENTVLIDSKRLYVDGSSIVAIKGKQSLAVPKMRP